jgi:cellulose synthase/poly-beta-1,6-N-acetylglucosamine synthase-like glycosyltransferase
VIAQLTRAGSALALAGAAHAVANAMLLRRPDLADDRGALPPVSVLVPARDEAGDIGACVRALLRQDGVGEVLVLDDCSSDGTAEVARGAGARVLAGSPPPSGWHGKPWACAQLATAADPAATVLVFVDADVRLAPGAVAAAVRLLAAARLDIACPFPRQEAGSAGERLVQPLLQWSWLTFLPLRLAERSPRPSLTAACGQFVVIRRDALSRAGGFAAVRGYVLDDLALVRAVKRAGGRGGVVDGARLASCRMYRNWPELRDGYTKSLWSAFGTPAGAAAVFAGLTGMYLLPPLAALRGSRAGQIGYAAAVASRVVSARSSGARALPDALAHPLSVLLLGWLTARSQLAHQRGTLRWKGRPLPR